MEKLNVAIADDNEKCWTYWGILLTKTKSWN